jgi:hypothetical protein
MAHGGEESRKHVDLSKQGDGFLADLADQRPCDASVLVVFCSEQSRHPD